MAKQPSKGPLGQLIELRRLRRIFARFTSFVKIATLFTWTPFAKTWEYLPNFGEFSPNLLFAPSTVFLDISRSN